MEKRNRPAIFSAADFFDSDSWRVSSTAQGSIREIRGSIKEEVA